MRQQGFEDFSALWQFFEDHVLAFTHELGRRAIVWQVHSFYFLPIDSDKGPGRAR